MLHSWSRWRARKGRALALRCPTSRLFATAACALAMERSTASEPAMKSRRTQPTQKLSTQAARLFFRVLSMHMRIRFLLEIVSTILNDETPLEFVPTFLGAHAIPHEDRQSPERYVDLVINEMLPRVANEKLAEFCDVFCEQGYFDIEQSREISTAAKKLGLKLRIHADQLSDSGGAKLAGELKATTADHLEKTEEEGIAAMKSAGVQPVLLPGSVYVLGSTCYPRAREMIEAELAVVIATDFNPGSSPSPSMLMMLSLACTQMKMPPAEAITASTITAAYSLNRGDKIGSLEQGKLANFSIFEWDDYREIAYWFGFPQINSVYVRGRPVLSRANET